MFLGTHVLDPASARLAPLSIWALFGRFVWEHRPGPDFAPPPSTFPHQRLFRFIGITGARPRDRRRGVRATGRILSWKPACLASPRRGAFECQKPRARRDSGCNARTAPGPGRQDCIKDPRPCTCTALLSGAESRRQPNFVARTIILSRYCGSCLALPASPLHPHLIRRPPIRQPIVTDSAWPRESEAAAKAGRWPGGDRGWTRGPRVTGEPTRGQRT